MIRSTLNLVLVLRNANCILLAALAAMISAGCGVNPAKLPPAPVQNPLPTPVDNTIPAVDPVDEQAPEPQEQQQAVEPRLFIANLNGPNVTSYVNPSTVNGNIAPDTNLQGAQTQLNQPIDILVNSAGQLLVANVRANSVTTYDDAATANGNLAPDGNVQGAATQLLSPVSLAMNTSEDLLFVANLGGTDDIQVFANTTQASFNGNLAPTRTISSAALNNIFAPGINFGANDDLYVANRGAAQVLVFANASSINGTVEPTRIITSTVFVDIDDVFIDGNDNMFVVDFTGFIYTFRNASTLNGAVEPDLTLQVPPAVALLSIAVDSNDTGYITDAGNDAVYSYDNISSLNGALAPDRTIQGDNTQLRTPSRLFLVE